VIAQVPRGESLRSNPARTIAYRSRIAALRQRGVLGSDGKGSKSTG